MFVLNAVAGMDQLSVIKPAMARVLPMVEFNEGYRYADYIPGKDRVAEYGIAALVAGAAAKAGLFKWLLAVLIASKKMVVIGLVAFGVFMKSLLSRK